MNAETWTFIGVTINLLVVFLTIMNARVALEKRISSLEVKVKIIMQNCIHCDFHEER